MTALAAGSAICVFATLFYDEIVAAEGISGNLVDWLRLRRFSLRGENAVGAWWQGMVLLLASLHAADGYMRDRAARPRIARAWTCLAIVLLALSIDEVGSIHERVMVYMPPGGWLALVPFVIVLGGLTAFALTALVRSPQDRRSGWLLFLAFTLFGTVALQEHLEFSTQWWGDAVNFRTTVEEGTEMAAMLLLVYALLPAMPERCCAPAEVTTPVFSALDRLFPVIMATGLMCSPLIAVINARVPDPSRGHPSTWLAAAGFLVASIAIVQPVIRTGNRRSIPASAYLAASVCLGLSIIAVDFDSFRNPAGKLELLLGGCLALVASWMMVLPSVGLRAPVLVGIAMVGVVGLALLWPTTTVAFGVFSAAGFMAYAGNSAVAEAVSDPQAVSPNHGVA